MCALPNPLNGSQQHSTYPRVAHLTAAGPTPSRSALTSRDRTAFATNPSGRLGRRPRGKGRALNPPHIFLLSSTQFRRISHCFCCISIFYELQEKRRRKKTPVNPPHLFGNIIAPLGVLRERRGAVADPAPPLSFQGEGFRGSSCWSNLVSKKFDIEIKVNGSQQTRLLLPQSHLKIVSDQK